MQRSHEIVLHPLLQHAKRFTECQIAHDVEAVKIEPVRDIHRFSLPFLDASKQLVCVVCNSELVIAQSWKVSQGLHMQS